MSKSLYAVLNVAPDADPAVIEAAYKALIKKYHPDMLAGAPGGDLRRAAEINEAFQVLRDPERRARYDNDERARQDAFRRAAAAASGPALYHPPPPRRRRKSRWPALLLLVAAAAAFIIWRETEAGQRFFGGGESSFALQAARTGNPAAVRVKDVDRAFDEFRRIRDRTGLLGLSSFSQDCFAGQSRSQSAIEFDFCVAFDHAAADYDAKIAGDDLPQLPRFRPDELNSRHEWAARLISSDEKWISARLVQLRALTSERLQPPASQPLRAVSAPLLAQAGRTANVRPATNVRRSKPAHYARNRKPARRQSARRADRDFLEREGYIY
ncbi:MAG: J domain-containing protein [Pseudomonadota bacterium]|nr:J domain-containing protein [Pseudomonadota bacterium]